MWKLFALTAVFCILNCSKDSGESDLDKHNVDYNRYPINGLIGYFPLDGDEQDEIGNFKLEWSWHGAAFIQDRFLNNRNAIKNSSEDCEIKSKTTSINLKTSTISFFSKRSSNTACHAFYGNAIKSTSINSHTTPNVWYHCACLLSNSEVQALYINGEAIDFEISSHGLYNPTEFWETADDIFIYDRMLEEWEIQWLYHYKGWAL